jgi:hypothetical protein
MYLSHLDFIARRGRELQTNSVLSVDGPPNPVLVPANWSGTWLNYGGQGGPSCNYDTFADATNGVNYLDYN